MPNTIASDGAILAKDAALEGFKEGLLPLNAFSMNVSPAEGEIGDTISVTKLGAVGAAVPKVKGQVYAVQDLAASKVPVVIDQHLTVGWNLTDRELAELSDAQAIQWGRGKGHELARAVLVNILSRFTIVNFGAAIHTAGSAGFSLEDLIDMGVVLDTAKWPASGRSLILNAAYHGELRKDPAISNAAAFGSDQVIRTGVIPNLDTFENVYKSIVIPENAIGLRGMAVTMNALLVAMRYLVPNDPSNIIEAERLTDAETGITMGYRRWTNPTTGDATTVLECLFGHAVGEATGAKLITSA